MDITGTATTRANAPVGQVEQPQSTPTQAAAVSAPVVADNGINVTSTKAVPATPPSESEVKHSIDVINKYLQPNSSDIEFSLDHDTGKTLVKIVDTSTHTVIRQIPTEQVVEISRDLDKLQGLLVRDKA